MSLEEALTKPIVKEGRHTVPCKDHLGNEYPSKTAMCKAYDISLVAFSRRIKRGYTLKDALMLPSNSYNAKKTEDHLGQEFRSVSSMCAAYGIGQVTFAKRIKRGMPLEEALTNPTMKKGRHTVPCKDHLGNEYPSKIVMCDVYGISLMTLFRRIREGHTLEDALTLPTYPYNAKKTEDHLGQEFRSVSSMCAAYGIERSIFNNRLESGMSIEEALTRPVKNRHRGAGTQRL